MLGKPCRSKFGVGTSHYSWRIRSKNKNARLGQVVLETVTWGKQPNEITICTFLRTYSYLGEFLPNCIHIRRNFNRLRLTTYLVFIILTISSFTITWTPADEDITRASRSGDVPTQQIPPIHHTTGNPKTPPHPSTAPKPQKKSSPDTVQKPETEYSHDTVPKP